MDVNMYTNNAGSICFTSLTIFSEATTVFLSFLIPSFFCRIYVAGFINFFAFFFPYCKPCPFQLLHHLAKGWGGGRKRGGRKEKGRREEVKGKRWEGKGERQKEDGGKRWKRRRRKGKEGGGGGREDREGGEQEKREEKVRMERRGGEKEEGRMGKREGRRGKREGGQGRKRARESCLVDLPSSL